MRPLLFVLLLCTCGPAPKAKMNKAQNSIATISYGDLSLSVNPEIGGRVTSYEMNGVNVLKTTRDENDWQWGSSIWTSPQSAWIGGLEVPFDRQPYQIIGQNKRDITLLSEQDRNTGLRMKKSFRFRPGETWVHLMTDYTLYNNGQDTLFRGLWENSRVSYDGAFTFLADSVKADTGIEVVKGNRGSRISMMPQDSIGGKVFVYPSFFTVGYETQGLRWTKQMYAVDLAEGHPEHSPLELHLSPSERMAEYGVHGSYRRLEPGDSTVFTVFWMLEKMD